MGESIALDIGGTWIRAGIVKDGKILKIIKKTTPKKKEIILKEIIELINDLGLKEINKIGISVAGVVDNGVIKNSPNLSLQEFNIERFFIQKYKVNVKVENDANCSAIAELKYGVRKRNFIVLTLGTGIGGGIIIDGKLYKGQGYGGELGHIIIDDGKYLETLASGKNLKNFSDKELKRISIYLSQGIASLISIFDPEVVVLHGGMKNSGSKILKNINKEIKKYQFNPRKVKIFWSKIENSGMIGASLL
jgi:predicted NBD/HSP70 family sugar kinase